MAGKTKYGTNLSLTRIPISFFTLNLFHKTVYEIIIHRFIDIVNRSVALFSYSEQTDTSEERPNFKNNLEIADT
jgi:hypothetical protein